MLCSFSLFDCFSILNLGTRLSTASDELFFMLEFTHQVKLQMCTGKASNFSGCQLFFRCTCQISQPHRSNWSNTQTQYTRYVSSTSVSTCLIPLQRLRCRTELRFGVVFNAMKAAGYCLVECGGGGDCFYHSMLFLARIYNQELYNAWHDHDKFRKQTCDNLLVTCYITMFCLLMLLSILTMYAEGRQFAFSGVIA